MSTANQAARAYLRILRPISEAMDMAAIADAGFDGGEWSDAASDRMFEDEECRVLDLVANRFGITQSDLVNAIYESSARNDEEWSRHVLHPDYQRVAKGEI
jgi:uncharacterized membrane protein